MAKRITEVRYNVDGSTTPLGTTFENVTYSDTDSYTLKDLYDYLVAFFDQDMFSMYSDTAPTNEHIKVWYDTSTEAEEEEPEG